MAAPIHKGALEKIGLFVYNDSTDVWEAWDGVAGTVSGTGTDNRITRWDGTTDVQDSAATLNDDGSVLFQTTTNSQTAFQLQDAAGSEVVHMDSVRPDLAVTTYATLNVAPNNNVGFPGSGAFIRLGRFRANVDSGTQSGAIRGVDASVQFSGNANVTGQHIARGFNSNVVWNSTGTAESIVGIQNFMAFSGGGAANATGLVTDAIANRAAVGVNTSASGSLTNGYSYLAATPIRVDANRTVTNAYGFYAEDQMVTGAVTNAWAVKVDDQSSGGYAIQTGLGYHEFGDIVSVKGDATAAVSDLEIAGSQSFDVTTLNAATLTLDDTHCFINVTYTATGAVTITLPSATSSWNSTDGIGRKYIIKDGGASSSSNNITINRAGSDTIVDTATGQTSTTLASNGGSITIVAVDSSTWSVI